MLFVPMEFASCLLLWILSFFPASWERCYDVILVQESMCKSFSHLSLVFLCVCCMCVHMKYTSVLACLSCTCVGRGQRWSLVSFFIALHLIFESNLSLNSEITILARLAGQRIPGTHLSLCPQEWGYETLSQHTWLLWVCKRSKLTFLRLHRMHFSFGAISSFVNPCLGSTYSCTNLAFTPKQVSLWEDMRARGQEFDVIQPAGKSSLCVKTTQDYIHSKSPCTHCCVGLKVNIISLFAEMII